MPIIPVSRATCRGNKKRPSGRHRVFTSPEPVLRARSVAIVGASERAKWPSSIFASLRDHGYPGKVYPINPRYDQVWGVRCYPNFAALPEPVDHALVIIPAAAVQATLEEATAHGLKSATVYAANIGEGNDPEIVARGLALKDLCRRTGLVIGGPNCMGAVSLREKAFFYPNVDLAAIPAGPVGAVFQSGGTLQFWCQTGAARGLKFSYMVSSGNELGIDLADYVNFLVEDEATKVIALFIEGIRRPEAFMAAANKALVAGKPIVAIKTGRSLRSRAAAQSHTGAIAGDYEAYAAMCDRYGVTTCESLDEMVEVALAFQYTKRPKGKRVGWVTTSGGTVDLLYDYMDGERATTMPDYAPQTVAAIQPHIPPEMTPKNPLDSGIPSTLEAAAKICAAVAADPAIDMIAWAAQLPGGAGKRKVVDPQPMLDVMAATDKPIVAFGRMLYPLTPAGLEFQDRIGIAHLQGLQPTIRALGALASFGAREGRAVPSLPAASGWRDAVVGEALNAALASHGVTPPNSAFVKTPAGAADAAGEIGFPVALKIVSADLSHKTEIGGVLLNLRSPVEVQAGAQILAARVHDANPTARLDGYLVQEMVSGVEVILGARNDPLYGPVLVVGSGGVMVELVQDVALRLLPVGPEEAREMIAGLKLSRLLAGYRGRPEADMDALIKAICGLSDFYLAHRHWLADIEINPLIVLPKGFGVRAVDVRQVYAQAAEVAAV
jgi:acyl-CoA synthetase (NDP forming)